MPKARKNKDLLTIKRIEESRYWKSGFRRLKRNIVKNIAQKEKYTSNRFDRRKLFKRLWKEVKLREAGIK